MRRLAFAQVDEGFHDGSKVATASGTARTKSDISFSFECAQGAHARDGGLDDLSRPAESLLV
jgi:hypothetical protein